MFILDYNKLYTRVIAEHHDSISAGHLGRDETYSLLYRNFTWPRAYKDIQRYVRNCHTCSRTKASRQGGKGTLLQNPVPADAWRDISVDFVIDLPPDKSSKHKNVMTVTDRFSKMKLLIPCGDVDARACADLFLTYV